MTPQRLYVAVASYTDRGRLKQVTVLNNRTFRIFKIPTKLIPKFVKERIAMLKLCEIDLTWKGGELGRRVNANSIHVYLSFDEYNEICNTCTGV